ncbi:MAG: peptidoglycan DD-metalloendopeptidase family protein [Microgenomates group bacterium]|jgi:murein DD-endopeptidase MepM/ murein hydrolase activator NlpD|nr:peptidoglycan DD-metalloendopeptidase family protein [Candidatus Woesebacteria bacterium]
MRQLVQFVLFFSDYLRSRTLNAARVIERIKDVFVAILIVKRGKYSSSFLNSSFILLAVAALVGGPIIAENNPFSNELGANQTLQSSVVSFNPYESNIGTIISAKPRDKVVDYSVLGGDTLSTIAKKFDVSTDTLKWANNLKSDTIKPGQIVKVPPGTGVVHKVISGDNIYAVAKKYNVDAQNILNFPFNDFADLDTFSLTPGQTLFIPNGSVLPPKPVASPGGFYSGPIQAGARGNSNFIWPTSGGITQYPIWYHMALDIANNALPPVLASDTGTVTFAGCITYGYGCHIIIDHGNGYQTLYGHLSSLGVTPGQAVSQGQQIGNMGSTGRSSGPHLHFEIRSGGAQLNPLNFLK